MPLRYSQPVRSASMLVMFAARMRSFSKNIGKVIPLLVILTLAAIKETYAASDLHASDYATPAYLDVEFGTVRANENERAVVYLIRTGDFRQTTSVRFKTEEMTATSGKDFEESMGTFVFPPGEGYKKIELNIVADEESEPTETFRLRLFADSPNTVLMRDTVIIEVGDRSSTSVPKPKLEITPLGAGRISLSWNFDSNFTLERSPDPSHSQWETVTDEPILAEARCEVIQETHGRSYFYRLHAR